MNMHSHHAPKIPKTFCHVCGRQTPIGPDRNMCTVHGGPRNEKNTEDDTTFTKHDNSKPQWSLLEWKFIRGIVTVLTFGAVKYSRDNWKLCKDRHRYEDAAMRHMTSYLDGEKYDPETGESHLSHIGCNLMFLHHFDSLDSKASATQN